MDKKLVVFDLDGTLLNTIDDLGMAANHMLAELGLPQHPLEQYPFMVGNGITKLIERALPEAYRTAEQIAAAREIFLRYYGEHCMDLSRPYPGIDELLTELVGLGVKVAVASNKYKEGVVKLIRHFFPTIPWCAVEGHTGTRPTKPDPAIVYDIMAVADVTSAQVLYVGDSGVDVDTAARACVDCVAVSWGFRPRTELIEHGATRIIDHPCELLQYL